MALGGRGHESGEGEGHIPVLLAEVLAAAEVQPGQRWIDGTFGRGGHSRALLEQGAMVLGLDQDAAAAEAARALEARWPENFRWKQRNFKELKTCCIEQGWDKVDGVLLDLGVSSPQLEDPERGFSFRAEGPLDMRMDRRGGPTAADLVNELSEGGIDANFFMNKAENEKQGGWSGPWRHGADARPSAPRPIWQRWWPRRFRTDELGEYIRQRRSSRLYESPSTEKRRPS